MKFGGRAFASDMFAGAQALGRRPIPGMLGFASGFPPDWLQKMLAALPEEERDDEIAILLALGMFGP